MSEGGLFWQLNNEAMTSALCTVFALPSGLVSRACDPSRHTGLRSQEGSVRGLVLCYGCSENLDKFISELVFGKWSPVGPRAMRVGRGDSCHVCVCHSLPLHLHAISVTAGEHRIEGTHDAWGSSVRLTVSAPQGCCYIDDEIGEMTAQIDDNFPFEPELA